LITSADLQKMLEWKSARDFNNSTLGTISNYVASLFATSGSNGTTTSGTVGTTGGALPPPDNPRGRYITALAAALLANTLVPDARQYTPPLSLGTPRPPGDPVTPTGPLTAPTIDRQIGNLDDWTPIFEDAFGEKYIFERSTGRKRLLSELVGNRLVDRYFADLRVINAINA
jgi:hypothetical protein